MLILDGSMLLGMAALLTGLSTLVWAVRRRP
jgi:hypothetical protein